VVDGDEVAAWRRSAIGALAAAIEAAPDARLRAYPSWTVRDLAVHVTQVCGNAALALQDGALERPSPEVTVTPADDPETLASAVTTALGQAEAALTRCRHEVVWTPVGPRTPRFWARRLLREAVLHRWDAEGAVLDGTIRDAGDAPVVAHSPAPPGEACALELVAEFLETDVTRALTDDAQELSGVVDIVAGESAWRVDASTGEIGAATGAPAAATVRGGAAAVWLWLMRRDDLPGEVTITDGDGSAAAFTASIDGFRRPAG
jgi:hypothetical protein